MLISYYFISFSVYKQFFFNNLPLKLLKIKILHKARYINISATNIDIVPVKTEIKSLTKLIK